MAVASLNPLTSWRRWNLEFADDRLANVAAFRDVRAEVVGVCGWPRPPHAPALRYGSKEEAWDNALYDSPWGRNAGAMVSQSWSCTPALRIRSRH